MSENDRMDRAKRIRQMREGNRDGEESDDETSETDSEPAADDEPSEAKQTADRMETADQHEPTADRMETTETASPDGGAATMAAEQEESEEPTAEASTDTDVPSGTSAPLPDAEQLEEALEESDAEPGDTETVTPEEATETADTAGAGAAPEEEEAEEEDETRVLEFSLDGEHYCLEIQYIEEIVKQETITRVPNTPAFVEGVVDLRGQITTILNPKVTIDKENKEAGELIVVFDSEAFEDQGHIGWIVDDVRQVSPILESEVNDPPMDEAYIKGVIDREEDDQFVIWTSPDMAFEKQDD